MLTRLAFRYQRIAFFLVAMLMGFGAYSYFTLPAQEDPAITIRQAIVQTHYSGLSPERIEELVTKPLERAIRRLPEVEEIRSSSVSGLSIIHVEVFDQFFDLDQIWDDLRHEVEGAAVSLPDGALPSVVLDNTGDVAVVTAALRSPDHTMAELGEMAVYIRDQLYAVDGVKSIDIVGERPERIYIESRNARLAELGISPNVIVNALASQNIIRPGGQIDLGDRTLLIEPTGDFDNLDEISDTLIEIPGTGETVALRDVAEVTRSLIDPAPQLAYYQGDPAVILAIAQQDGQNVLEFGPAVADRLAGIEATLPVGFTLDIVTFQPDQVEQAVFGVSLNVLQTLGLVLAVVVLLLGLQTGLIVGAIIPAITLATLAIMGMFGLPLERMSLATLVIALGILVDNGIVVAEDFKRRLGDGEDRDQALENVGSTLAMPLLVSTGVTILVFLPLMLAEHVAGEYTRSISIVIAITLSISWLMAMTITPILSHRFATVTTGGAKRPLYERAFDPLIAGYEVLIAAILRNRALFIAGMLVALVVSAAAIVTNPQRFFPGSDRAQIITYIDLPANVTTTTTNAEIEALLPTLTQDRFDWLVDHVAYVGFGGPRFVLSLTPIDPAPNRAVLIFNVDEPASVDRAMDELRSHFEADFSHFQTRVTRMFLGPSDSSILEVQIKGPDRDFVYATARKIEDIIASVPGARDIRQNWENRIARLVIDVDQAQARRAGVTSADVAQSMSAYFSGRAVSQYREGDDVIPIVARATEEERSDLDRVRTLAIFGANGVVVPLMQVADVELVNGFSRIEREDLTRTVTIEGRSDLMGAEDMVPLIEDQIASLEATLPPGHSIEFDGIIAQSAEGRNALAANLPLSLGIIVVLLIAQFNSFRRPVILIATIPLIIVGVALGLRLFGADFGFMPILGMLSLAGIIMCNAIVLIDRIDLERRLGKPLEQAVIEASKRRLRPIIMTTVTTILGLLPLILSRDPLFFGMAVVMATGLAVGAVLTLGFVPVLYTLLFRREATQDDPTANESDQINDHTKPLEGAIP
ncbi:MAG: efflux RND transporter permease subunit [Roseitalea sp.]|jgi:multidrug efflux pump subunit AcrB|nr:efflux RND transporter permease subunit [Roseitalea sp.]MBO6720795.1 efflux RND transporter permease subunit [Roseitalea sp.]MBO6743942.1 efflux RND transporter permease subunit [Roseitalea sp.]